MDRNETIAEIKKALQQRSGKPWSVTGGKGSAYGWIKIISPPKRCREFGSMTDMERVELGELLGLDRPVHHQGCSVPSSSAHYREYVDRANGRKPAVIAEPYWD